VTTVDAPRAARARVGRRILRIGGTLVAVVGVLLIAWAFVVWQWQDPFTGLYTRWQQHKLEGKLERVVESYRPLPRPSTSTGASTTSVAAERRVLRAEAARFRARAAAGSPIGKIAVPRLGLHMVLVNGTDHDSLTKGPGRDSRSYMPGQGQLVYIAGHRTTYLAPFAHIDSLRPGDRVTLTMPYATIVYTVTGHVIVDAHDLSVLQSHNRAVIALQACHPRFFASHRYIVWAKPTSVTMRNGATFAYARPTD
jgi:sortase A